MPRRTDNFNWDAFLGRRSSSREVAAAQRTHEGKCVLITGAGGSIGSALALKVAAASPRLLVLLDSSEQNLYQIHTQLERVAYGPQFVSVLGDIADQLLLDELLSAHRPELVYHAAAFKHVPLMEMNPIAAVRNNTLGTYSLAKSIARHSGCKLIMVSTDKAVDPHSAMGVSKRLAELVLTGLSEDACPLLSVRLGNVLGSHGSVAFVFLRQIAEGGPVTVTHPEARRYFLTLDEATAVMLAASQKGAGIWTPQIGKPLRVQALAEHLMSNAGLRPMDDISISYIGPRPGDKLLEHLVSGQESLANDDDDDHGLRRVVGPQLTRPAIEAAMSALADIIARRDSPGLIRCVRSIVPNYTPSEVVEQSCTAKVRPE